MTKCTAKWCWRKPIGSLVIESVVEPSVAPLEMPYCAKHAKKAKEAAKELYLTDERVVDLEL